MTEELTGQIGRLVHKKFLWLPFLDRLGHEIMTANQF
jgi:hypothetical protein